LAVLECHVERGVLRVSINRPEQRNALSLEVLGSIEAAFRNSATDKGISCVVLTGRGDRSFAAGGDLKELDSLRSIDDATHIATQGRKALDAVREFPVPVIAALNGLALGGGAELALACDFRLAAPGARLGFIQGTLNISTAWGGAADLIGVVGASRAMDLLVSSRVLSATDALALQLIDRVCPGDEGLDAMVEGYIAAWLGKPPHVLRALTAVSRRAKSAMRSALGGVETAAFITTWTHDDHWRAATALLTKTSRS
jgi:enoyl-CoA hydratase